MDEMSLLIDDDAKTILTGLKRIAKAELSDDNTLRISVEESNKMSSEFLEKEFPNCKRFQRFQPKRFLVLLDFSLRIIKVPIE